jgi:hypothetical protein
MERTIVPVASLARRQSSKASESMLLLRCQHSYGKLQVWLPMDLMKLSAQLNAVGVSTTVVDLNIEPRPKDLDKYTNIGVGVLGPPYVPISRRIAQSIFEVTEKPVLLGGPGVKFLEPGQFAAIYGKTGIQITNDGELARALSLPVNIPSVYDVSIAQQIRLMERNKLTSYLGREFSFFVSQGCKYNCDFCVADKAVPETFSRTIKGDLDSLCSEADKLGIKQLAMYLTSLDTFQNPARFKEVLKVFIAAKQAFGIDFRLRGLSRIDSFLNAMSTVPELYELIPKAGLKIIGFGVDGTTKEEWKSQHKGNKSLASADEAFSICKSLDTTPENLMVMGFHDKDGTPVGTEKTLQNDVEFSIDRALNYGVVARPHLAKDMVPGSKGWKSQVWERSRNKLLGDPDLFINLDFLMLGSEITHPNEEFRQAANRAFMEIIDTLPEDLCTSNYLLPHTGDKERDKEIENYNRKVPIDR